MNLGFLDGGTAAHEFGHAIGLAHEHQNPAGWHPVERSGGDPRARRVAEFWDEATMRHNVSALHGRPDQRHRLRSRFDHAVLLPGRVDHSTASATKANEMLSAMDKQFIAGAKMYPKTARAYGG